jgi:hypothetical protein
VNYQPVRTPFIGMSLLVAASSFLGSTGEQIHQPEDLTWHIEVRKLLSVEEYDAALIVADKIEHARSMQPGQGTRHGFKCNAKVVRDIAT